MTINRSNNRPPKYLPQAIAEQSASSSAPIEDLPSLKPAQTSSVSENKDEVYQAKENPFTKTDDKRGWLENKIFDQAKKLDSDGDQVFMKIDAKAHAWSAKLEQEITIGLSRSGSPSQYILSAETSQLAGIAMPRNSPVQAYLGLGQNTKVDFAFSSPEAVAEAVGLLADGEMFKPDSSAAEIGVSVEAGAGLDLGMDIAPSVSVSMGEASAKAKHQVAMRYESTRDGPDKVMTITRSGVEYGGSLGLKITTTDGMNRENTVGGPEFGANKKYNVEHTRGFEVPKGYGVADYLGANKKGKLGRVLPETVKIQEQSNLGVKVAPNSLTMLNGEMNQEEGVTLQTAITEGKYSLMETVKAAYKGDVELRDYLSTLGKTQDSHYQMKELCGGAGFSEGVGFIGASISVKACHQDRMAQGETATYFDKACVPSDTGHHSAR
jgi:hypothetical protein